MLAAGVSTQELVALRSNVPDLSQAFRTLSIDVNADGARDLVLVSFPRDPSTSVYLNDGQGRFSFASSPVSDLTPDSVSGQAARVEQFDYDGDGDEDLVVGNSSLVRLLRNDGAGVFTEAGSYSGVLLGVGDFDRQAPFDLLVSTGGSWKSSWPHSPRGRGSAIAPPAPVWP